MIAIMNSEEVWQPQGVSVEHTQTPSSQHRRFSALEGHSGAGTGATSGSNKGRQQAAVAARSVFVCLFVCFVVCLGFFVFVLQEWVFKEK